MVPAESMSNLEKQRPLNNNILDKALLLTLALLTCALLIVGLWLADRHQVNSIWILLVWNSIGLIAAVGWGFRKHWKKPSFILFFLAWMAGHAVLITFLMGWVSLPYWLLAIGVEFFIGYLVANLFFGFRPDSK